MTGAAITPAAFRGLPRTSERFATWPVFVAALLGVLAISLRNLADPIIRHDDFPAYFGDAATYWPKTLNEGRWLNYWWHLRGIVTPAWLNFALYQLFWAIFAAGIALCATGGRGTAFYPIVLALMVLVAPPATLIAPWFNTLIPGLGLVALYAVLGWYLRPGQHRALLPLFVPLTFMAYTTYPLLLLAVCLARPGSRSLPDLARLLALFIASFALAVLVTFTLNWQVHGIFGVPPADWREGTPASDLPGLLANLPLVAESLWLLLLRSSFQFEPAIIYHLALLTLATGVLLRHARMEALYLHAALWLGMALMVVQILKLGILSPPRAFAFAWVFYALIVVRAVMVLSRHWALGERLARNLVLLVVGSYLLQTFIDFSAYRPWQAETRQLAQQVAKAVPGPVILRGDVMQSPTAQAAYVQTDVALVQRMRQLAGKSVTICGDGRTVCPEDPEATFIDIYDTLRRN
jgi:hypothetical protein